MRKLIYYVAVTVDGYIAAADGSFDFFPLEGDHLPWLIDAYPETMPGHVRGQLGLAETSPRVFDTVLMGRATHQVAVDEGLTSGYPHLRQFVFTSNPDDLPADDGLTVTSEDPVALVRGLKAEDSPLDIWLCGGGALAATLLDQIDEFRLKVNPFVLGAGIPLVGARPIGARSVGSGPGLGVGRGAGIPLGLTQRLRRDFDSGVSYVEYARA